MIITTFTPTTLRSYRCFDDMKTSADSQDLYKMVALCYPHTLFKKVLGPLDVSAQPGRKFHFQDKFEASDYEILYFRDGFESEVYCVGFPEKILPFLKEKHLCQEILQLSSQWVSHGKSVLLFARLDSDQPVFDLYPPHYQNQTYLCALVGIGA